MKGKNITRYIFSICLVAASWWLLSLILDTPALPDPLTSIIEFVHTFDAIYIHILYSSFRIFTALVLGIILSVPLGLVIGRYRLMDFLFSPAIYLIYPIPKISLLPVIMLILGLGNMSKIVLIFIIVFFQIVVACRDEAARIKNEEFYFMKSIDASQLQMFYHIVFPHSLPAIFTSIRLSLGTSISVLFFSENYGTDKGIGYFIIDSWMRVNYPEMFAGIIGISLMGIILFLFVDILEKKICPWK